MKTSVFVSSCDKYSHVWPVFKHSFQKYWKDCPYTVYFVTNELEASFGNTIKTGPDREWSNQTIQVLEQIDSEIIIFLLTDFWFVQPVNTAKFRLYSALMKAGIEHIRLYSSEGSRKIKREPFWDNLEIMNQDEPYRCSFNAGIWRTQTLLDLIEPNKSIWDSEHIMSERSKNRNFLTVTDMEALKYDIDKNMVEKTIFKPEAFEYMKREDITL